MRNYDYWKVGAAHEMVNRRILQEKLGFRNADHFRKTYILPAIKGGLIEMTIPDKPKSRLQKYILTSKGRKWLEENPEKDFVFGDRAKMV